MSADIEYNSTMPFSLYHRCLTGLLIIHTIQIQNNILYNVNNTTQNDQACVLFPSKKCCYCCYCPRQLARKALPHQMERLVPFSFMRFTCICSQFLVKTAAVRRHAVYIIYWHALIFLFCSVTKFQNAACTLQTKAKSAVCQMYLDVLLILNKSLILTCSFP